MFKTLSGVFTADIQLENSLVLVLGRTLPRFVVSDLGVEALSNSPPESTLDQD
jgi:hypothetical protein